MPQHSPTPPETKAKLLQFVRDTIEERRAKGQALKYITIKRLTSEQFSYDIFDEHKATVSKYLELAEKGMTIPTGLTVTADGKFEETLDNLLQIVNSFIDSKKLKNQNVSYPTIKRHLLQHFSPEFFSEHKTIIQQRLENAFRRDPSNGQFIEAVRQATDPAKERSRHLESMFANIEVVLANFKLSRTPYPLLSEYELVVEQVRQQIGPQAFSEFETEITGHLQGKRSEQQQMKRKIRSKLRYFTDFAGDSVLEQKLAHQPHVQKVIDSHAKSELAGSIPTVLEQLREASEMWNAENRAGCLVRLQSICVDSADRVEWLKAALEFSRCWTEKETDLDRQECMRLLIVQEACEAIFSDSL